jgi:maleylpyruvate isomerase
MILYGYWRSSAAWRVRIALALKGLTAEDAPKHLRKNEQRTPEFLAVNPQGLLPALRLDDGQVLTQSLAICEYLDEVRPEPPLLPPDPVARARVRAAALVIAADTHPLQNLTVLQGLREVGLPEEAVQGWARDVIGRGLGALERLLDGEAGPFAFGDAPTLADLCLVPQLYNARRFGLEPPWRRLLSVEAACLELEAFRATAPDLQPDAE